MKLTKSTIFSVLFLFTTIEYNIRYTNLYELPTIIQWTFNTVFILFGIFLISDSYNKYKDDTPLLFVKLFLIWNMIIIFRGFFIAENYWEWKNLLDTMFIFFIPLFVYLFINTNLVQKILSFWFKYMIYLVIIFIPFINHSDFLGRYFSPITFLLLIFPLLSYRWKVTSFIIALSVILLELDARSNVIKLSVSFCLGSLYYFRAFYIDKFFKIIHFILMLLPLLLLILGIFGIFNIFKMSDYIKGDYHTVSNDSGKISEGSLTADTRSLLYIENIASAIKHNYVIQGRTPANGYDSNSFGNFLKYELGTGKQQRFSSEVSILNIFTWNGLIGVILYFFIFLKSSYLAIYKSNNYFIKVIGLFVAFRWAYAFVEDFTVFDIQYILLWIFIGICFSSSFRNMTDIEFKTWVKELLNNASLFRFKRY